MRLSVSNLPWAPEDTPRALQALSRLGAHGVEVAPTKIAPWNELTTQRVRVYRSEVESAGLRVSSLQAIFYGLDDVQLLSGPPAFAAMSTHLRDVLSTGQLLGAEVAVYGAPGTRRLGELPRLTARTLALERFTALGDIAESFGIALAIEPVPVAYGGEFLTSAPEVIDFVRELNHPFVKLHLDTGCAVVGGDPIDQAIQQGKGILRHFHVAEPQLGDFRDPKAHHIAAAEALRCSRYDHWIAIEMRQQDGDVLETLSAAIRFVKTAYEIY